MGPALLAAALVIAALVLAVVPSAAWAPTRMAHAGGIATGAPVGDVHDDIRVRNRPMRWSAWPGDTESTRALDARTIFFAKGQVRRIARRRRVA